MFSDCSHAGSRNSPAERLSPVPAMTGCGGRLLFDDAARPGRVHNCSRDCEQYKVKEGLDERTCVPLALPEGRIPAGHRGTAMTTRLRPIAEPFVVARPSGARVRTRLAVGSD